MDGLFTRRAKNFALRLTEPWLDIPSTAPIWLHTILRDIGGDCQPYLGRRSACGVGGHGVVARGLIHEGCHETGRLAFAYAPLSLSLGRRTCIEGQSSAPVIVDRD